METKVGQFTKGAGTTTVVSGLSFKPKGGYFWTANTVTDNTWTAHVHQGQGVWADMDTIGIRQQSVWLYNQEGVTTVAAQSGVNDGKALSTKDWQFSLVPASDGFTVTWSGTVPLGVIVNYIVFGGPDVQLGLAPSILNIDNSTPNGTSFKLEGFGFTPSSLITIYQSNIVVTATPTYIRHNIGNSFVDGNTASAAALTHIASGAASSVNVAQSQQVTNLFASTGPGPNVTFRNYLPDGLEIQAYQGFAITGGSDLNIAVLAMRGVMSKVMFATKPTGAATANQVFSADFPVKAAVVATVSDTAFNKSGVSLSFGASDGSSNVSTAIAAPGVATAVVGKSISRNNLAIIKSTNNAPTVQAGAPISFSGNDATLAWNPNDAVATYVAVLLFGDLNSFEGVIQENEEFTGDFKYSLFFTGDINENDSIFASAWGNVGNILGIGQISETEEFKTDNTNPSKNTFGFDLIWSGTNPAHLSYIEELEEFLNEFGIGFDRTFEGLIEELDEFVASKFGRAWDGTGFFEEFEEFMTHPTDESKSTFGFTLLWDGLTKPEEIGYIEEQDFFDAYFQIGLPIVRMPDPDEMAGTVNWHINPSVEKGLIGWTNVGSGTITQDPAEAWDRGYSAHISTAGSSPGEGLAIRSISGLELIGLNERGLPRVAQSQVRLKGAAPSLTMNIQQVVTYLDTTTTVSDVQSITITDSWNFFYAPAVEIDYTKKLRYVEILVTTPTAMAVGFYADGAQIEEDRGEGPTAWASGSYGHDVGTWVGPSDASMTVRQPLPLVVKGVGKGGYAQMSMKLWRCDYRGRFIEDLSYWVESGKVSCSRKREITWNFDCIMKKTGWDKITKNYDWVAPVLRMDYPDGTHSERQLGLYFVVPSSMERTEWEGKVQLTAFDPLWLLKVMAFTGNLRTSEKGVNRMRIVRNIVETTPLMGEPGSGFWNRFDIPGDSREFKKAREWDKKTNRLSLANEILEQMGYYPLFTNHLGIITTRRRGEERPVGSGIYTRLKDQTPVRAWVAHLPEGASVDAWIPRYAQLKSEVIGAVKTDPLALDNVDEILIVNDDPDLPRINVKGKIKRRRKRGKGVQYFVEEPKGKTRRVYANYVEDQATALEVASALADDLSSRVEHATINVLPDPDLDYIHSTALFALWDARKEDVLVGQYAFDEVEWNFDLNNCIQSMKVSYVDNGDAEISGIDSSVWS